MSKPLAQPGVFKILRVHSFNSVEVSRVAGIDRALAVGLCSLQEKSVVQFEKVLTAKHAMQLGLLTPSQSAGQPCGVWIPVSGSSQLDLEGLAGTRTWPGVWTVTREMTASS